MEKAGNIIAFYLWVRTWGGSAPIAWSDQWYSTKAPLVLYLDFGSSFLGGVCQGIEGTCFNKLTTFKPLYLNQVRPWQKVYGHLLPLISHLRNKLKQKIWGVL